MQAKKLIYILTLLSCVSLFAQNENKGQGIELPDFVITGIQSVSVPIMDKKKSEFTPIIGSNFLLPNYDAEEFSLLDNSSPIKQEMDIKSSLKNYNGLLQIGVGVQTFPIGNLSFGFSESNLLFNSHLFGSDTRDYVTNSGYNTSGAEVKLNYFVNHKSSFLPGLSIGLEGDFLRDQYYFYGTSTPDRFRENEKYFGKLFLSNKLSKNVKYGMGFSSDILNIKSSGIFENVISINGFYEQNFSALSIGATGNYQVQKINDNSFGFNRADFLQSSVYLKLSNSKIFDLKLGAEYSKLDTNRLVNPFAVLSIFVEEGVALFISYQGSAELITYKNLMDENRYFETSVQNIFQEKYSDLRAIIKYDFSDIFELNAGFYSASYDNYHYFEDTNNDSRFNVVTLNQVAEVGGFLNLTINAKRYGELFANLQFQSVTDTAGLKIPYKPLLSADISYGYDFNFGLYTKLKVNYSRFMYTNLSNTLTVPDYLNLSVFLKYSLFRNFALTCSLENLLNREDYLFKNYQEKPRDIILGVEYRW